MLDPDNEIDVPKSFGVAIGATVLSAVVIAWLYVSTLVWGRVFMAMWGWFVVPFGVVPIKYWHAVGLLLLLKVPLSGVRGMREKNPFKLVCLSVVAALIAWGVAAIVHYFMITQA